MLHNVGAPLHVRYKERMNAELPAALLRAVRTDGELLGHPRPHRCGAQARLLRLSAPVLGAAYSPEDGSARAAGEFGEICGHDPALMLGYYKRPDLSAAAIVDGWLHTGDAGYVDEDGSLFLVDRLNYLL